MISVRPVVPAGRQLIQAYREGGFTVAGVQHRGSVLVLPDRTLVWPVSEFASITVESLAPVAAAQALVELLVLGCGQRFALVPPALREALRARGIAVEAMATPAACRTYNVLLAEDRRVAAALIAV